MQGFFVKYQQLFLENSTGSKNGECVLWARKMRLLNTSVRLLDGENVPPLTDRVSWLSQSICILVTEM